MANESTHSVVETEVKLTASIDPNLEKGNKEMRKALLLMNELRKTRNIDLLKFSKSSTKLLADSRKSPIYRDYEEWVLTTLAKFIKENNALAIQQMQKDYSNAINKEYSKSLTAISKKVIETKPSSRKVSKKEVKESSATTNTKVAKELTERQKGAYRRRIAKVNAVIPNRLNEDEFDEETVSKAEADAIAEKARIQKEEKEIKEQNKRAKEQEKLAKQLKREQDKAVKEGINATKANLRARAKRAESEGDMETSIVLKNLQPTEEDLGQKFSESTNQINIEAEFNKLRNSQIKALEKMYSKQEARKRASMARLFQFRGQLENATNVLQGANLSIDGVPYDKINADYVDRMLARETEQRKIDVDRAKTLKRYEKDERKENEARRKQEEKARKYAVSTQFAIVKSQIASGKAFSNSVAGAGNVFASSIGKALGGLGAGYLARKTWQYTNKAINIADTTVKKASDESLLGITMRRVGAGMSSALGAGIRGESLEALDRLFISYGGKKGETISTISDLMTQTSLLRYGGGQELLKNAGMFNIDIFDEKGDIKKPIDIMDAIFRKIRESDDTDKIAIARTFGLTEAQTYAAIAGADLREADIEGAVGKYSQTQERFNRATNERRAWEDRKEELINRDVQKGATLHALLNYADIYRRKAGTLIWGVEQPFATTKGTFGEYMSLLGNDYTNPLLNLPTEGANYSPFTGTTNVNNGDIITNIYGGDADENARKVAEEVQKVVQPSEASN